MTNDIIQPYCRPLIQRPAVATCVNGALMSAYLISFGYYFVEYASVDRALDEMLTFMDVLEERSDDLFAKMQELLADSRQTRLEMQAAREHDDDVPAKPDSEDAPS